MCIYIWFIDTYIYIYIHMEYGQEAGSMLELHTGSFFFSNCLFDLAFAIPCRKLALPEITSIG